MNPAPIWCGVLIAVAVPCALEAGESFPVTRASVIAFGQGDGDAFGLDDVTPDTVMVLVQPQGESCALRFPLKVGQFLRLRAAGDDGRPMTCEATLVAITGEAAQFSSSCVGEPLVSNEPKCPPEPASASAAPAAPKE